PLCPPPRPDGPSRAGPGPPPSGGKPSDRAGQRSLLRADGRGRRAADRFGHRHPRGRAAGRADGALLPRLPAPRADRADSDPRRVDRSAEPRLGTRGGARVDPGPGHGRSARRGGRPSPRRGSGRRHRPARRLQGAARAAGGAGRGPPRRGGGAPDREEPMKIPPALSLSTGPAVGALGLRALARTLRIRREEGAVAPLWAARAPAIYAGWHERVVLLPDLC